MDKLELVLVETAILVVVASVGFFIKHVLVTIDSKVARKELDKELELLRKDIE